MGHKKMGEGGCHTANGTLAAQVVSASLGVVLALLISPEAFAPVFFGSRDMSIKKST